MAGMARTVGTALTEAQKLLGKN